jgi:hypothetical protein
MNSKRKNLPAKNISKVPKIKNDLIEDLRQIIEKTRQSIAKTINANLTILYWHVGNRIRREILEEERAEYGKKIIANVSKQLASDYGNGFNEKNLRLGGGFSFLARQKRITIDDEDFHIDLLFFHRDLKRIVAIELLCGAPHNSSIKK